jgi:hypothetical protein
LIAVGCWFKDLFDRIEAGKCLALTRPAIAKARRYLLAIFVRAWSPEVGVPFLLGGHSTLPGAAASLEKTTAA